MADSTSTVIGVDLALAKDVFQLHWIDKETGEVINKKFSRKRLTPTNVVVGAMANRILRTMRSMLVHGTRYGRNHISVLCG